jgi:polygalacturonase
MKVLPLLFAACVAAASALAADLASSAPAAPDIPAREFSAAKLGVAPDLGAPVTAALQKAIDHVGGQGGGKLVLAPGDYLVGPLRLTSRLDLHLSAGAVLKLLPREQGYPSDSSRYASLLSASGASDLRIGGPGRIDGQGEAWWRAYRAKELSLRRPQLILLDDCERVELSGFTSINPPNTHVALRLCRDVTIRDVTLEAPDDSPNTDGLNLSGKNYLIERCRISTGDDNIVVLTHSGRGWPSPVCENFVIRDCALGFGHGLSIGSYTGGGIRGILAERITFDATTSGIRMKADRDRGGLVENLVYRDITMRGVKNPVFISSHYPKEPRSPDLDEARPITERTPRWKNILIENLRAEGSQNSIVLWGLPERPLEDVTIRKTAIASERGAKYYYAGNLNVADVVLETLAKPAQDSWPVPSPPAVPAR